MGALATAVAFPVVRNIDPAISLRLRPTPLEMLEDAIDLDNLPKGRLEEGLDRLLHDIEKFQEPERWDGMS
jgi:hypothetical protein